MNTFLWFRQQNFCEMKQYYIGICVQQVWTNVFEYIGMNTRVPWFTVTTYSLE